MAGPWTVALAPGSSGPREADSVNLPLVLKLPPISYTPVGRRDLRLDFLRGFCAFRNRPLPEIGSQYAPHADRPKR